MSEYYAMSARFNGSLPGSMLVILVAAFLSSQMSFRLREDTVQMMIAANYDTLTGKATLPEFQNRILFPILTVAARATINLDDLQIWKALRFGSAVVAFAAVFSMVWALTRSVVRARVACVLVAYGYLWTAMTYGAELPSDFFDVAFMAGFVLLAIQERYALLAVLAAIAALNRESAAFGGVIVMALTFARYGVTITALRHYGAGIASTVMAVLMVIIVRTFFTGEMRVQQRFGIVDTIAQWRWFLQPYGPGTAIVAWFVPIVVLVRRPFCQYSVEQRGLLHASAIVLAVTVLFGVLNELRVLLPLFLLLVAVICLQDRGRPDHGWLASLIEDRRRTPDIGA